MQQLQNAFAAVGARLPRILLPTAGVDLRRFAVIACDQYSARPEYWDRVAELVGEAPSTLRMILPEAYLDRETPHQKADIHVAMRQYCQDGTLQELPEGLIYLQRRLPGGIRNGLMIALDLEQYDFHMGSHSMIRATEKTVEERLPVRVKIRRGATLELPHVMVLLNDRKDRLNTLLKQSREALTLLYDFELMEGGGHLTGWQVRDRDLLMRIVGILAKLKNEACDGMLYAVGDGNHSLAAAKLCWEELKKTLPADAWEDHPARWALVELVNLYDPVMEFLPIHRLLMNVDPIAVQKEIGFDAKNPPDIQELQPRLDAWLQFHPEAEIEYIHGEAECRKLGEAPDRLPIILGEVRRDTLFETVAKNGALVRKSFSMGEAAEKRYYLECRRIRLY